MTNEKLIKLIKEELKTIEKEYDLSEWDYTDIDSLSPTEAHSLGYYRALTYINHFLSP